MPCCIHGAGERSTISAKKALRDLPPTLEVFVASDVSLRSAVPVCPIAPALLTLAVARFFWISRCTRRAHTAF